MGFRELKAELIKLDKDSLIKHISELYKKYKPVKEYFDFYLNPDEKEVLAIYKDKASVGNTYANAVELMNKHGILDKYKDRALKHYE